MRSSAETDLLPFYQRELAYLRNAGAAFAARYPRLAARLELGEGEATDPHVERLIESFAFLTARLQHKIERDFVEIPAALLAVLHPYLAEPVPPLAIARVTVDPDQGNFEKGYSIPRDTALFTQTDDGETCRFRTAYPLTLWPVTVAEAGFVPVERYGFLDSRPTVGAVLRLRLHLEGDPDGRFERLGLDTLRFHLSGDRAIAFQLYELLFTHCVDVLALPDDDAQPVALPQPALAPVGFAEEEALLPTPPAAPPGYRLLQEYFAFADKFLFFTVGGLRGRLKGRQCDLLFLLDTAPLSRLGIDRRAFSLGCVPVVNLFPWTAEPIRVDQTRSEYRLIPDARAERTTEIHSVLKVSASGDPGNSVRVYAPYFSCNHQQDEEGPTGFWVARRELSRQRGMPGTDMFLAFLDLAFTPEQPADSTVYVHALCTNRDLAEQISGATLLQAEVQIPASRITIIDKPTRTVPPPLEGETLWRLVSQLSLNHLSLSSGPQSLGALKEILRLHTPRHGPAEAQQINGLRSMTCRPAMRRIGRDGWRGFCQGTEIVLTFDTRCYVGASAYLLASVLNRFFALYAPINSFTQLTVRREGEGRNWKTWPPMVGEQELL